MEGDEEEHSTPQSSVVSSVVVVGSKKMVEGPREASRTRYLERVKDLDLENLACRQELTQALGITRFSHEDLSNHYCVDWLKVHEAHFSRAKTLETTNLTGIPQRSIMGPINYRPLKERGSPGLRVSQPSIGIVSPGSEWRYQRSLGRWTSFLSQRVWDFLIQPKWVRNLRETQCTGDPVELQGWPVSELGSV